MVSLAGENCSQESEPRLETVYLD